MSQAVRAARGTMHFAGNGASACMASHMALDWTKNAGVRALAYNDLAYLTAIGNDLGYDQSFAQPVSWFAEPGDLLVTISSSGNSPNVLKAIAAAREKRIPVVTFSGLKPDNASRRAGDLNLYVPGWTYGLIECAHQVLLHAWLDAFMEVRGWELTSPQVITPPAR
jgi:D-sedoheptulose 7-phosphate isomerase